MTFPTAIPDPDDEKKVAAAARDAEAELVEEAIDAVAAAELDEAVAEAAEVLADERIEQAADDLLAAEHVGDLAHQAETEGETAAAEDLRGVEEELVREARQLAQEADDLHEFAQEAHGAADQAAAEAVELTTEAIVLDEIAGEAEEAAATGQLDREIRETLADVEPELKAEAEVLAGQEVEAIAEQLFGAVDEPLAADGGQGVLADFPADVTAAEAGGQALAEQETDSDPSAEVLDEDELIKGDEEPRPERPVSPYDRPGRWFVVHTQSGYEKKVKQNLEARISSMNMEGRIFEVVIPMEDVVEFKGGKKVVVQKKMFPGYLLVRCLMDDDSWTVIRNTPGVTGFVGQGAKPSPLPRRDVESFLQVKSEAEEGERARKRGPRLEFEVGETVRIKEGPFADFSGQITEINEEQLKVKVEVDIFGRPTPVELEFAQIAKL